MKDENKTKIINAVTNLSTALKKYHPNTETCNYVEITLTELKKKDGKAFTGAFLYFLTKASMLRTSENVILNDTESKLWHKMSALKNLGNDFFFGICL